MLRSGLALIAPNDMRIVFTLLTVFLILVFGFFWFLDPVSNSVSASEWHPKSHYHLHNEVPECDLGCHATEDDCLPDDPSPTPPPTPTPPPEPTPEPPPTPEPTPTPTPTPTPSPEPSSPSPEPSPNGGNSGGGNGGGNNGPIWGSLSVFSGSGDRSTSTVFTAPDLISLYQKLVGLLLQMKVILMQGAHLNFKG